MPSIDPFGGVATQRDADIIRQRVDDIFGLAPPGSVIADPERRGKLFTAASHVIELTLELAAVQRFVPGQAGRLMGPIITGVEKDPGTGKVGPKAGTAGNLLPSPAGFLDPTAVGLQRNFYIPPAPAHRTGAVDLLPGVVDRIGLGIPEQRAEDAARRAAAVESARLDLANALTFASADTVNALASGRGGFTRAGELRAFSRLPDADIRAVATAEQARRGIGPVATGDVSQITGLASAATTSVRALVDEHQVRIEQLFNRLDALDEQEAQIRAGLAAVSFPAFGPVANGSLLPESIQPVNDKAKRNQDAATGIRRQLVSERADP